MSLRILQIHNNQAGKGGAPEVVETERRLLEAGGHNVAQYIHPSADEGAGASLQSAAQAVWNRSAARQVRETISTFKPDVAHVHTPFPVMSPVVFRAAHGMGVPTVTTLHSYRWSCVAGTCFRDGHPCEDCVGSRLKLAGIRHRCYRESAAASGALTASLALHRVLGTQARHVDRWLTLTSFAKRLLIRDGIVAEKIEVKPNSVPDKGVGPGPEADARTIVFAARLLDIKGVDTLVRAWPAVSGRGLRLVVAGDGPKRPDVERLAAAHSDVEYRGWVDEAEITALMSRAEAVLVASTWYEGLPLVILRSLSVGTPVLCSDVENFREDVLADGAGESFVAGDPGSLSLALGRIADDPARMRVRRDAARRSYVARYSPAADLSRLERIYTELAAKSVRPG
jgi:glycosyltransferase involved in cell wall biosynthesis